METQTPLDYVDRVIGRGMAPDFVTGQAILEMLSSGSTLRDTLTRRRIPEVGGINVETTPHENLSFEVHKKIYGHDNLLQIGQMEKEARRMASLFSDCGFPQLLASLPQSLTCVVFYPFMSA